MKTAADDVPTACDDKSVETIVNGSFTDAGRAIGSANLATLQRAAQLAEAARQQAAAKSEPSAQFRHRAILCRARIRRIAEQQKASF